MKRVIRDHFFPRTVAEALDLKRQFRDLALFVAGGTDVFVRVAHEDSPAEVLVDLTSIELLSSLEEVVEGQLNLGACLTADRISMSPLIREAAPSLSAAAGCLGSPAIRNQATIGGNLINASPAGDMIPPLIAFGARAYVESPHGPRSLLVEDLLTGVNQTALEPEEMLIRVSMPAVKEREGATYLKLGLREALTISVASVAVWLRRGRDGALVENARIAMGSVAPRVIRARQAESALVGRPFTQEGMNAAAEAAASECRPISDLRASADYRRSMVYELVRICLDAAWTGSDKRERGNG